MTGTIGYTTVFSSTTSANAVPVNNPLVWVITYKKCKCVVFYDSPDGEKVVLKHKNCIEKKHSTPDTRRFNDYSEEELTNFAYYARKNILLNSGDYDELPIY